MARRLALNAERPNKVPSRASDPARGPHELAAATYFDRLRAASVARDSLLCVGLDPDRTVVRGGLAGAVEFCRTLPDRVGVVAIPSAVFYDDQEAGRSHVRFACCKRPEVLTEALARLSQLAP